MWLQRNHSITKYNWHLPIWVSYAVWSVGLKSSLWNRTYNTGCWYQPTKRYIQQHIESHFRMISLYIYLNIVWDNYWVNNTLENICKYFYSVMIQRDCLQSWIKSSQLLPRMPISWPWRTCKCIGNDGHQRYLSGTNQFMMHKGTLGFPLLKVPCYWNKKKRIMKIHFQYAVYSAFVNFFVMILFLHLILMLQVNIFHFKVVMSLMSLISCLHSVKF